MQRLMETSGGIDVHQSLMVASIARYDSHSEKVIFETREFSAFRDHLLEMAAWLKAGGVTKVALESTGVYWVCAYDALEELGLTPLLVNAAQVKKVPGRKTDVLDSQWLAQLLMHGLLKASYIPEKLLRDTRHLTRHRANLVKKVAITKNQLHRSLEARGIKLASVCSRLNGKSAGKVIAALIAGEELTEAGLLLKLHGSMHKKIPEILAATRGRLSEKDRWLLQQIQDELDFFENKIDNVDRQIDSILAEHSRVRKILETIPGISETASAAIVAEIGCDVETFSTSAALASWVGIAPGSNESAGKVKSAKITKGNVHIRRVLIESAHAASRTPSQFKEFYDMLRCKKGVKRAIVAVAHKILRVIYSLLNSGRAYVDPKVTYSYDFVRNNKSRWVRQLMKHGFAKVNHQTQKVEFA